MGDSIEAEDNTETDCKCGEVCGDDRFKVIETAKRDLLDSTNISGSDDEMKCLDSFLFRCWQMGWLDKYRDTGKFAGMRNALLKVKDAFETDTIYAPGASPTYEQSDAARKVYKAVKDALGDSRDCPWDAMGSI